MSMHGKLRLAVLISGQGSNLLAIARACAADTIRAEIVTVIADRDAPGIAAARELGLHTAIVAPPTPAAVFEAALQRALAESDPQLIVLAGFMRILSPSFVQQYLGRMLNIHPSLLPRHKGLHTHRRVLQAAEHVHGSSVHFVTDELDGGPVLWQARLTVRSDDDEQSLHRRVQALEHRLYPEAIGLIAAGRARLDGATIRLDGQVLTTPLLLDASDTAQPAPGGHS